jgi:hypothetical protein
MRQCPKDPELNCQAKKSNTNPQSISSSNVEKYAENRAIFLQLIVSC